MRRDLLDRIITFGTILTAIGFVTLGPSQARLLVCIALCVWTLPQLVLLAQHRVRFSVWRFLVCWMLVPLTLGLVFFYTSAMIGFGGPFGQLRLYGYGPWLTSVAIGLAIGFAVAIGFATVARGATEALLLVVPRLSPRRDWVWPILYILGVTIAVIYRYSR